MFIIICIFFTFLAVGSNKEVQRIKTKFGNINLVDSDIRFEGKPLIWVLILGFVGGWVAGALGLGGGAIFNPALLALGVPPKVSSATGLYLVCFSKIASCFIYYLAGELNMPYSLWIALWSVVGSLLGIWLSQLYMKASGRQSVIVWTLSFIFVLSVVAIPIFGSQSLRQQHEEGVDILAFKSLCD